MEFGTTCNVLGVPGHSWQFVACSGSSIGHKSLILAAKAMACSVLDLMTQPQLLERVREEHQRRLSGREYKPVGDPDRKPPLGPAKSIAKRLKASD